MPYLFRIISAVVALSAVAALSSIGLYSVVAGGVLFGAGNTRSTTVATPVLVTIQAAPVTPTLVLIPTSTPMPASLIPGLGQPAPALALPTPTTAPASTASAPPAAITPPSAAGSQPGPTSAPRQTGLRATHDGLTLEVMEIDRDWQPRQPDGSAGRAPSNPDLLAVHVRLTNGAGELRFAADDDLVLVTDDGARLAPRQAPPLHAPHLLTVPVPAGDSVRGWLTYDAPAGAMPRRLQWSPTRPDRPRAEAAYIIDLP